MADPYDILIKVKAQLDEIHKFLGELRAVGEEISKINGLNFSAVSKLSTSLKTRPTRLAKARKSSGTRIEKQRRELEGLGILLPAFIWSSAR